MAIFVKTPTGKTVITLNVAPSDTVKDLKRKIMDEVGIPPDQQRLFYEYEKLKDDRTVDYYKIHEESILQLYLRGGDMQLFVKTASGKTLITLDVVSENTIQTVKKKIKDEVGMPVHLQELTFNEIKLKDDHTLSSYNIRGYSTLHLALGKRA